MLVEIKVPDLAESVPDATCLAWMKNEGDHITEGENLIDLETDKVTLEIVAPHSGMVISILKKEGEIIHFQAQERHRLVGLDKIGVVAEIWIHTDLNNLSDENDIVRINDDFNRT